MAESRLQVFPTVDRMSQAAAELFARTVGESMERRGYFSAALSGGNTPVPLFHLLAGPPYREGLPWERMYFFWADERCVPPDHPESNFGQARLKWFRHISVPEQNLHRILGELPPSRAAQDYNRQLRRFADEGLRWPRLDFVLLGLGSDGHTASLFPGSPVETGAGRAAVAIRGAYRDRPADRVSLTPAVFNAARLVVFLVCGEEKADAVAASRQGRRDPLRWPAQRIRPEGGKVVWLIDEAAARYVPK